MLPECLHTFTLSNYLRLPTPPPWQCPVTRLCPPTTPSMPTPPPRQCPMIFHEVSAMLPHHQIWWMVLNFENAMWRTAHIMFPTVEFFHFMHATVIRVQTGLKIKCNFESGIIRGTPWHFKVV